MIEISKNRTLEEEFILSSLISRENTILNNFLLNESDLAVLELGCSFPKVLIQIYHLFGNSYLEGVDKLSEEECTSEFKKRKNFNKEWNSFFEIYTKDLSSIIDGLKPEMTGNEFDEKILKSIKFKTDIIDYEFNYKPKFSLITAMNILHFLKDKKSHLNILKKIKDNLKDNGIFLMRVRYDWQYPSLNQNYYTEILKEVFPDGEVVNFFLHEKTHWDCSWFCNKKIFFEV